MRIKKLKTQWRYVSNWGGKDNTNSQTYSVAISDVANIQNKALALIQDGNTAQFSALLQEEFVYSQVISAYSEVGYCNFNNGMGQRDDYSYEEHQVVSILEALLIDNPEHYWTLYSATETKPEFRKILLNFTDLDLRTADLSSIDFSLATFINTNLSHAKGITQEKLDQCLSFDFAQLPDNLNQVWSADKGRKVIDDLVNLKAYGRRLMCASNVMAKEKGKLLVAHADILINLVLTAPKHDQAFQSNFLLELRKHDKEFDKNRDYGIKKIILNLALFILGAGVFYVAAAGVNYAKNDRVLFFSSTTSKEKLDKVAEDMLSNTLGIE